MGAGASSPRSNGSRTRSNSASSVTNAALNTVTGGGSGSNSLGGSSSSSHLLKEGSGAQSGLPSLKPKEYLGPDGGFYIPMSGIYPNVAQEWDVATVMELIDQRRLAPFYRGLQDELELEDSDSRSDQARELENTLDTIGAKPDAEVTGHHGRIGMRSKEPVAHKKAEAGAYLSGTDECPICMMNFPNNMNTSRCCAQPICTECLVQIKRQDPDTNHVEPEAVACPFCVEPDFGILYEPPPPAQRRDNKGVATLNTSTGGGTSSLPRSSTSTSSSSDSLRSPASVVEQQPQPKPRRKSVPADTPEVVSIDALHPNFHIKVEAMRATVSRRANRRIVFRRVGDRLVPIGITSSRHASGQPPSSAEAAAAAEASSASSSGNGGGGSLSLSPRRMRRNRGTGSRGSNDFLAGHDLEELMVNEAIRLSLMQSEEEESRREGESNRQSTPPTTTRSSPPPRTHIAA